MPGMCEQELALPTLLCIKIQSEVKNWEEEEESGGGLNPQSPIGV